MVGDDEHIAAASAITTVRSAKGDELLASKADRSTSTVTRTDVDGHFVDESNWQRLEQARRKQLHAFCYHESPRT